MNTHMSQITRQEVLARKRERYAGAGKEHKTKIINELVELFGYHRKAAIGALRARPGMETLKRRKRRDPQTFLFGGTLRMHTMVERRAFPRQG